jgi:hypothetical protein
MPRTQGNSVTIGGQTNNYFFIDWTESVNYSSNTSTISWASYFHYTLSDAQLDDGDTSIGGSVVWDNGGRVKNYAGTFTTRDHLLASGSITLGHDNSGGGSFNVSGSVFGSLSARSSASANYGFTAIDRTPTTPSISSGSRGVNGLSFSAIASGSVNNSGPTVTLTLQRSTNNVDFIDISSTTTSGTTLTASSLSGTTTYYFRVKSSNSVSTRYSSTITSFGVPTTPTSVTPTLNSDKSITVTSSEVSSSSGTPTYYISYSSSSDGGSTWGSWSSYITIPSNARVYTYSANTLPPGFTYRFKMYTSNSVGSSLDTTSLGLFLPAGGKLYNGTSWVNATDAKVLTASGWQTIVTAKMYDGTQWVNLT